MELRTLRAFVEVVRQGGFSQAAKTLFATQSTVSKAVKQLEDEIGVRLLDRIGHRSQLTAAGEVVYRRALRLLAEREDLLAELEEIRGLKRGLLRLGMPRIGASTLFAPVFATYRNRYPGIEVRLVEQGSDRLEELLRAGEIDLAASLLPVSEDFAWQGVRREPLVALLPEGHPLLGRRSITFGDLRDQRFVLFEEGFALNRIIGEACGRHGFAPEVVARSSQIEFIVALAAAGLGVAFLPRMIAEQRMHPKAGHVLVAEPESNWHMAVVWRRDAYLPHAAKAWLDILREAG